MSEAYLGIVKGLRITNCSEATTRRACLRCMYLAYCEQPEAIDTTLDGGTCAEEPEGARGIEWTGQWIEL